MPSALGRPMSRVRLARMNSTAWGPISGSWSGSGVLSHKSSPGGSGWRCLTLITG